MIYDPKKDLLVNYFNIKHSKVVIAFSLFTRFADFELMKKPLLMELCNGFNRITFWLTGLYESV